MRRSAHPESRGGHRSRRRRALRGGAEADRRRLLVDDRPHAHPIGKYVIYRETRLKATGSLTQGLQQHPLAPLSIPLPVEYPLPGTKIQLAVRDRYDHLMTKGQGAEVRGGVVLAGARVVAIVVGVPGCNAVLEPIEDVLPQTRLVIVDEDRRGDVHGRHEHEALADSGGRATGLDLIGDVDDLLTMLRVEGEILRVRLHQGSPPLCRP